MPVLSHRRSRPVLTTPGKYINLNSADRFVDASILKGAYRVRVELETDLVLGIVDTQVPEVACAVSSLLTRSLEDARDTHGGYLPGHVVDRVQRELISPYGVAECWGPQGRRFILARSAPGGRHEIVASCLVAADEDTIFFFTSRLNNLRFSLLSESVDLGASADGNPRHRWFDKFRFPGLDRFKPRGFHQIANFVVEREGNRGRGLARALIHGIRDNFPARGLWQVGDPPWLARMSALGFHLRAGAESFHVDVPWDRLPPTSVVGGRTLDHRAYNAAFGLPHRYEAGWESAPAIGEPLPDRVPEVMEFARRGDAKVQYVQMIYPFKEMACAGV